ncbi:MAG: hypothetical protein DMG72_11490 [Acidobacteria bacterium]|nr:MAG: hypothetical protein DMG72_11490 [Acidobacteriota bacterium]
MNPLSLGIEGIRSGSWSEQASTPSTGRILKAARDFESVLLNSLLHSMQETFSGVSGENKEVGSDDYSDIGTEALAAGLSASGGLGIARMIMKDLTKTEVLSHQAPGAVAGANSPPLKLDLS